MVNKSIFIYIRKDAPDLVVTLFLPLSLFSNIENFHVNKTCPFLLSERTHTNTTKKANFLNFPFLPKRKQKKRNITEQVYSNPSMDTVFRFEFIIIIIYKEFFADERERYPSYWVSFSTREKNGSVLLIHWYILDNVSVTTIVFHVADYGHPTTPSTPISPLLHSQWSFSPRNSKQIRKIFFNLQTHTLRGLSIEHMFEIEYEFPIHCISLRHPPPILLLIIRLPVNVDQRRRPRPHCNMTRTSYRQPIQS